MRDRVVVKWGGGLITQKDAMKTVRHDVLDDLAEQLEACLLQGLDVVLVHGAGSFGHLKAKTYQLAGGKSDDPNLPSDRSQEEAVIDFLNDMLELNEHVLSALTKRDISAVSLPPINGPKTQDRHLKVICPSLNQLHKASLWSPTAMWLIAMNRRCLDSLRDDLVYRLATELSGVKRLSLPWEA